MSADLDVVNALDIGHAGARAQRWSAVRFWPTVCGLKIGREIGERIVARIVVVLILPHEAAEREHACWRLSRCESRPARY